MPNFVAFHHAKCMQRRMPEDSKYRDYHPPYPDDISETSGCEVEDFKFRLFISFRSVTNRSKILAHDFSSGSCLDLIQINLDQYKLIQIDFW